MTDGYLLLSTETYFRPLGLHHFYDAFSLQFQFTLLFCDYFIVLLGRARVQTAAAPHVCNVSWTVGTLEDRRSQGTKKSNFIVFLNSILLLVYSSFDLLFCESTILLFCHSVTLLFFDFAMSSVNRKFRN